MSAGNDPDKLAKLAASIQSVPIFVDCDPAFVESCSSLMSPETVHSNTTLCEFGERGDRMWVLTSGSVNLLDGDGDVSTSLTATDLVTPAFGELCLFEDSPDRQFTIVATTQAEVRVLTGVQLRGCFADHPGAESAMRMSVMSKYNTIAENRLRQQLVAAQARVDNASAQDLPEAEEALQKIKARQAARVERASRQKTATTMSTAGRKDVEEEKFTKTEEFLRGHDANGLQASALNQLNAGARNGATALESEGLLVPARQHGFFNKMGPINLVQNDTKPWIPTGEGPGAWFVIDMGCSREVYGFSIMNTDVEGRSTAAFDILVSDDAKTGYTTVISGTLDADTDLVQRHNIFRAGVEQPLSFRYFKFRVQHIRGEVGAGLRYISPKLDPEPEPMPVVDESWLEHWQEEIRSLTEEPAQIVQLERWQQDCMDDLRILGPGVGQGLQQLNSRAWHSAPKDAFKAAAASDGVSQQAESAAIRNAVVVSQSPPKHNGCRATPTPL